MQILQSIADKIFENCLQLSRAGILKQIAGLDILSVYVQNLPNKCAGIRNLISYLVIEFLAKLQKSFDYIKENVDQSCDMKIDAKVLLKDLNNTKRKLKT